MLQWLMTYERSMPVCSAYKTTLLRDARDNGSRNAGCVPDLICAGSGVRVPKKRKIRSMEVVALSEAYFGGKKRRWIKPRHVSYTVISPDL